MTIPRRISERWLAKQREILSITAKTTNDGQPNPAHPSLATEIEEATAELKRWKEFEAWVRTAKGFVLNAYPAKGYEAGKVFVRKDPATKVLQVRPIADLWAEYSAL